MTIKFKNLEQFSSGKTSTGYNLEIPIPKSSTGKSELICKNESCVPKHFMIGSRIDGFILNEGKDFYKFPPNTKGITCPYCGQGNYTQNLVSKRDQEAAIDTIKEAAFADISNSFSEMLKGIASKSRFNSRSGFGVTMTIKGGSTKYPNYKRPIREDLLRNTSCSDCGQCYGVYALGFFCPDCGNSNFIKHFQHETEIIQKQLELSKDIKESGDIELAYRLIGNALEDSLTVFETFLKRSYLLLAKKKNKIDVAEKDLRNLFQNMQNASNKFLELEINIKKNLSQNDLNIINEITQKRHVIGHNLSLADTNLVNRLDEHEEGKTVPIAATEVHDFMEACSVVLSNIDENLKSIKLERNLS